MGQKKTPQMCFREFRGNLSMFALDFIKKEKERSFDIGLDPSVCDQVLRTVYRLPCALIVEIWSRESSYTLGCR